MREFCLLIIFFIGSSINGTAQDLKRTMLFVMCGNTVPVSSYAPTGYHSNPNLFSIQSLEPALWVNKNNVLLSLRVETYEKQWVERCTSFAFTAQYQVTKKAAKMKANKLKVLAGIGIGNYRGNNETLIMNNAVVSGVPGQLFTFVNNCNINRLGINPRLTVLYWHVCIMIEYNLIETEHLRNQDIFFSPISSQMWTTNYTRSESYLSAKIGYCFYRTRK